MRSELICVQNDLEQNSLNRIKFNKLKSRCQNNINTKAKLKSVKLVEEMECKKIVGCFLKQKCDENFNNNYIAFLF